MASRTVRLNSFTSLYLERPIVDQVGIALFQERAIMKLTTASISSRRKLLPCIRSGWGRRGRRLGRGSAGSSAGSSAGASGSATGTGSTSSTTGAQGTTGTNVGGGVKQPAGRRQHARFFPGAAQWHPSRIIWKISWGSRIDLGVVDPEPSRRDAKPPAIVTAGWGSTTVKDTPCRTPSSRYNSRSKTTTIRPLQTSRIALTKTKLARRR